MRLIDEAILQAVGLMPLYSKLNKALIDKTSYIQRLKAERNKASTIDITHKKEYYLGTKKSTVGVLRILDFIQRKGTLGEFLFIFINQRQVIYHN